MTSVLPEHLEHSMPSSTRVVRLPGDCEFTRIETIHVCLLALAEEMYARYRAREHRTGAQSSFADSSVECELSVLVVIDDVAELCQRLERLWQQISTALNQPGSPAVTALTQLHCHGHEVGLHIHAPAVRLAREVPTARTARSRAQGRVRGRRLSWGRATG